MIDFTFTLNDCFKPQNTYAGWWLLTPIPSICLSANYLISIEYDNILNLASLHSLVRGAPGFAGWPWWPLLWSSCTSTTAWRPSLSVPTGRGSGYSSRWIPTTAWQSPCDESLETQRAHSKSFPIPRTLLRGMGQVLGMSPKSGMAQEECWDFYMQQWSFCMGPGLAACVNCLCELRNDLQL